MWLPSHATRLAALVGIGRGVDLIIYTWVAISLMILLNLHLKLRAQMELITVLAREIAIANAGADRIEDVGREKPSRGDIADLLRAIRATGQRALGAAPSPATRCASSSRRRLPRTGRSG